MSQPIVRVVKRPTPKTGPELPPRQLAEHQREHARRLFEETFWNVWGVLSWITYRDPLRFYEIAGRGDLRPDGRYRGVDGERVSKAVEELIAALRSGSVTASVDGNSVRAPAWAFKRPWEIKGAAFRRHRVMKVWPLSALEERPRVGAHPSQSKVDAAVRERFQNHGGNQKTMWDWVKTGGIPGASKAQVERAMQNVTGRRRGHPIRNPKSPDNSPKN